MFNFDNRYPIAHKKKIITRNKGKGRNGNILGQCRRFTFACSRKCPIWISSVLNVVYDHNICYLQNNLN